MVEEEDVHDLPAAFPDRTDQWGHLRLVGLLDRSPSLEKKLDHLCPALATGSGQCYIKMNTGSNE